MLDGSCCDLAPLCIGDKEGEEEGRWCGEEEEGEEEGRWCGEEEGEGEGSWGFRSGVEPTERDGREEGTVA